MPNHYYVLRKYFECSAEEQRAAMLACASAAIDKDDLRMLLGMLGLPQGERGESW